MLVWNGTEPCSYTYGIASRMLRNDNQVSKIKTALMFKDGLALKYWTSQSKRNGYRFNRLMNIRSRLKETNNDPTR